MIGRFLYWLTSYPMTFVEYRFTDVVDGRVVSKYRDRHGREFLANHRWSRFRVPLVTITLDELWV